MFDHGMLRAIRRMHRSSALTLIAGAVSGALGTAALSAATAPTEHKGLEVEPVGMVEASSIDATVGLAGHKLQLRAITIMPGGQIATHSHATRPGLVKVISGEWIEGRDSGENAYGPDDGAIVEDENTTHWVFNRGDEPATAMVCDIVPDG